MDECVAFLPLVALSHSQRAEPRHRRSWFREEDREVRYG